MTKPSRACDHKSRRAAATERARFSDLTAQRRDFIAAVLANEFVVAIFDGMRSSHLPEWYLSGGCLFQTVWNIAHGFEPTAGILDYDLFYFDGRDLSARSEQAIGEELARTFAHLPIAIEAANQARVHLWYEREFKAPCRAFERCEDGIDWFLATCCSFAIRRIDNERFEVYAPHGFDDLFGLVVRPNPRRTVDSDLLRGVYRSKVARWSRLWPRLEVAPWPSGP
jgi:uncharacterized protein